MMIKKEKDDNFKDDQTPLIVFLNDNAGNIGLKLPYFREVIKRLGVNVLAIAYRGYSYSDVTKKPNEEGLKLDAETIIKFLEET